MDKVEIIVVNDGSGDDTQAVAEEFVAQYPNTVRLINQENKGHGGALNTGCSAAQGKYLKVIDADDWVETDNLSRFTKELEKTDSDVVLTHHYTINISTGEKRKWKSYPGEFYKAYTFEEIMQNWKNFDRSLTFHGITYNTAFYKENCISLSEHVFYEDHEFATIPCCKAKSITPLDLFIYNYRIGDVTQSVSDTNQLERKGHTKTVLFRLMDVFSTIANDLAEANKKYFSMKTQGLLLSYLSTVLLLEANKGQGRKYAKEIMVQIKEKMPLVFELAKKQYRCLCVMNYLHISKKTFQYILNSKVYNKLRSNHDFS
jgi:glycosyltransferase involved in cell wall biosynthesis